MKEYTSDKIRNVAVLSHDGAGKTAVVESLLLACGAVDAVVFTDANSSDSTAGKQ